MWGGRQHRWVGDILGIWVLVVLAEERCRGERRVCVGDGAEGAWG